MTLLPFLTVWVVQTFMPVKQKSLPLFGIGIQGKSPKVTAQRRLNCYFEITKDGDRSKVYAIGTPGLELFLNQGETPWRGLKEFPKNSKLYGVHRSTLYEIDNAGTATSRGTLSTSEGDVDIEHNGTEVCVVDGTSGYIYDTGTTTFSTISDGDFPSSPRSLAFNNGRFLVGKNNTGEFYASDLYDGLNWTAGQFATAEASPDNLVRLDVMQGIVCLFGDFTAEFWTDTGSSGFPYARIPGAAMEWGLAARRSLAPFDNTFAFLARNRTGQVRVCTLSGFQALPISDPELDYTLNNFTTISGATGFGYMLGGHPMYQLNVSGRSWLYDGLTKVWSELASKGIDRHRGEIAENFINSTIVSDYSNGKLYRLKQDVYTDNADEIALELIGRHLFSNDKNIRVPALEIIMESGVGLVSGQGSDPQIMVSFSKDGGHSFGKERWTSFGKIGEYKKRARWRQNGRGRDVVVKARITDPVKRVIVAANWLAEEGQA